MAFYLGIILCFSILILFVCCLVFSNSFLNASAGEIQEDFPILKGPYLGQKPPGETPELFAPGIVSTCVQHSSGYFIEREKLEYGISSDHNDGYPYIAHDESFLLFGSFRPGSIGMSDLYVSFQRADGTWTQPKNLGRKINSEAKDVHPFVSADGKYLFFMSSRISRLNSYRIPDGPGNVYWVKADFLERIRKKELRR